MSDLFSVRHEGDSTWVPLINHARNIEVIGGTLRAPSLKGQDANLLGVDGELWLPKVVGPRIITFGMWVIGADPTTGNPPGAGDTAAGLFLRNLAALSNLLFTTDKRLEIRRERAPTADPDLYGRGQYAGGLDPQTTGYQIGRLVVDIKMTDPHWYTNTAFTEGKRLW